MIAKKVMPIILEDSFLKYELKARPRPDILRVVFGPCAEYCPCEVSEQKRGQK